jgi:hypothetical protein
VQYSGVVQQGLSACRTAARRAMEQQFSRSTTAIVLQRQTRDSGVVGG